MALRDVPEMEVNPNEKEGELSGSHIIMLTVRILEAKISLTS